MKLILPILLFQLLNTEERKEFSNVCPDSCKCMFNPDEIEKNVAVCKTGDSTVSFAWQFDEFFSTLALTCKVRHLSSISN